MSTPLRIVLRLVEQRLAEVFDRQDFEEADLLLDVLRFYAGEDERTQVASPTYITFH